MSMTPEQLKELHARAAGLTDGIHDQRDKTGQAYDLPWLLIEGTEIFACQSREAARQLRRDHRTSRRKATNAIGLLLVAATLFFPQKSTASGILFTEVYLTNDIATSSNINPSAQVKFGIAPALWTINFTTAQVGSVFHANTALVWPALSSYLMDGATNDVLLSVFSAGGLEFSIPETSLFVDSSLVNAILPAGTTGDYMGNVLTDIKATVVAYTLTHVGNGTQAHIEVTYAIEGVPEPSTFGMAVIGIICYGIVAYFFCRFCHHIKRRQ